MPYGWGVLDWRGEADEKNFKLWLCDIVHWPVPPSPMYVSSMMPAMHWGMQYAQGIANEPTSKGWEWHMRNGYVYITPILPSPDDVPQREEGYRQFMATVLEDPWGYWVRLRTELQQKYYDRVWPVDIGHLADHELTSYLRDCFEAAWQATGVYHFHGWLAMCGGLRLFRDLAADMVGIKPSDVVFSTLLSGFDNSLFEQNRGIAELATNAIALKVDDNFKLADEEVLSAMEQSDAGKQWLKSLYEFINTRGWRILRASDLSGATWLENPFLAVPEIRQAIAAGGVHVADQQRERLVREREEAESEVLSKVSAGDRELFERAMRCCQASHRFAEDHIVWIEFKGYSLFRLALLELGKRLTRVGLLEEPEDTMWLPYDQLLSVSLTTQKTAPVREWVRRNKEEYDRYLSQPPGTDQTPIFIGDPAALGEISTADTLLNVVLAPPVATPEEVGAACVGSCGAPGVVEGIARVIMDETAFHEIQPGDILIAPMTKGTWTPYFGIIKAVVTDGGGLLAHPAIVAREYGIPAVAGCLDATRKIKTGDRVRVDGNLLRVYVIK